MNAVLNSSEKRAEMLIEKNKKATLSNRILKTLPPNLKNKKISQLKNEEAALEQYLSSQDSKNENEVKEVLKIENINKKSAKQILAAIKVQSFLKSYSNLIENSRKQQNISAFNWGDITQNELGRNLYRGGGCLLLTPEFIKNYFEMVSTGNRKIKALRAVHAHKHHKFERDNTKGFIEILPVAGELNDYDRIRKPVDYAQIVQLKPKVKEWEKRSLKRKRNQDVATIGYKKPFYKSKKPQGVMAALFGDWSFV